ncbi:MAG: YCF48-related protein [Planctomycetota bacterium]
MRRALLWSVSLACLCACTAARPDLGTAHFEELDSGVHASLRGVSVVSSAVAWVSGAEGTVLRTLDGGAHWTALELPGTTPLDYRMVVAFDADHALVASAGSPARVFATGDGGHSWQLVHRDDRPAIFFDALAFADPQHGYLVGDPIGGEFIALATDDGGAHWHALDRLPPAERGEALFAASNRSVQAAGPVVRIATGGSVARVLRSGDAGATWSWARTPLRAGKVSAGAFAMTFADDLHGTLVGGDYLDEAARADTAAFTVDGGRTWQRAEVGPRGYCSSVACAPSFGPGVRLAVGPRGADLSRDGGRTWAPLTCPPCHAVAFADDAPIGFAVGPGGRIVRITSE